MKRRDFLIKSGKALALAAVAGGTGLLFHNRPTGGTTDIYIKARQFEVPFDASYPAISLVRDENHVTALNRALDAVGGIARFVKPGERVTIKPNVAWDRTPRQAANTNPQLVGEMVQLCLAAGAAEVIVTDVTCNDARRTFLRSGIKEAAEKAGGKVILPIDDDYLDADLNGQLLTVWPVLKYFVETDRIINMPIVKHHSLTSCTIGMKNLYGIIGGRRHQLHQQIDQSIVDLAAFVRPTLTVVDATRVLMRGGPQGGSLADVEVNNSVICSTDQVAAEARTCAFLGLMPENVGHIMLAEKSGIGKIDYRSIGYKEIVS
jgi:uncharacterized protein (DUF362 family)